MKSGVWKIGAVLGAGALLAGAIQLAPVAAQSEGTAFQVDSFSQLQIQGGGHAIITIGSPAAVSISGSDAEIANLQVQVWFNTLEIDPEDDDASSTGADLVYHITVPSLTQIELEGSVTAEVDGLTTDSLEVSLDDSASLQISNLAVGRLEVQLEGSSSATVSGKADSQQIENEDSSSYDALQLDTNSAEIVGQGSSHSKIRFMDSLSGQIEDSSVVDYMTESGSVSVSTQDSAQLNPLAFETLAS